MKNCMENLMINGECGEIIELGTSEIKSEDTQSYSGVIIGLDGMIADEGGNYDIILSPSTARELSRKLLYVAELADAENYLRLTGKYNNKHSSQ